MENYMIENGSSRVKLSNKDINNNNNNSNNSSDDSSEDDKSGIGRTYECNFCKRGFTNAQALGGHMNIHRKDKAKAREKQQSQPTFSAACSISYKPKEIMEPTTAKKNYYDYYPFVNHSVDTPSFSSTIPSSIYEVNNNNYFATHTTRQHMGTDLSLSNDCYHGGLDKDNNKQGDYSDIDLELRLGYHPY